MSKEYEIKDCKIQIDSADNDFFVVKCCNVWFEYASMRDVFSTNDVLEAEDWMCKNAKEYNALTCVGYKTGQEL